ncbi:MAG: hypothetical protein SPF17_05815, partial [Candidatus Mucispirillum faecigallinarum]|nr:hypothetical protein [Candidatus Mucispirillum faecigallinarum]
MEKLKEIFQKLKNTEIKFKKPDFNAVKEKIAAKESVTFKNKKINLQSLKNLSLQDIRNFDYRSFYT